MEISEVRPENFQINLREWPVEAAESRLFQGYDSSGKKIAFKVYSSLPLEQIRAYVDVTNGLAKKINGTDTKAKLELGGVTNDYLVEIVPVSTLGVVANPDKRGQNLPCTISPFVEGPTLFDLDPHYQSRYSSLDRQNPLSELSQKLGKLSEQNIAIIPWNVKPIEEEGRRILKVTDICGSVKSLQEAAHP